MAEEELARFIDRWTIEYIRAYAHPIDRVWRAITDSAELSQWFITPTKWNLETGGAYRFHNDDFSGTVLQMDPPRFIRFGDHKDAVGYFQYELEEIADGTRMRFVQHFSPTGTYTEVPDDLGGDLPAPGTPWKPGFVGGWHAFWDALGDFLDGALKGSRLPSTEFSVLVASWAKDADYNGFTEEQTARAALQLRREERWNELNKIYRAYIKANCPPA